LKAADVTVAINPTKPRKGAFVVTADDVEVLALTDMKRPFPPLKALDMDAVAANTLRALNKADDE